MRARLSLIIAAAIPVISLAVASGPPAHAVQAARPTAAAATATPACNARPAAGRMECLALIRTNAAGQQLAQRTASAASPPAGYSPAQLQAAYQLAKAAAAKGGTQTVAIVDAYDDPAAEADLAVYRAQYGLPACTTANGCFRKVNQAGAASPLPLADPGWAVEESLDIEMVSAVCPRCRILLAEGNDDQDTSLAATVATAARLGATEISNSYGEPEYPGEARLEPFFRQPGVQITAAAGDAGYGTEYPAASANVTAVGGTRLWPAAGGRGWAESTWAGTGSGCSTQIAKPAWQHDACTHRTVADVAAIADPQTAVAVYDSFGGAGGWLRVGGTSAASPIVAGVYALLGDPHAAGGSYYYSHRGQLFDVTSGANGTCEPGYLCTARAGYDGPTGLGTPDFTAARFAGSCASAFTATPAQQAPTRQEVLTGTASIVYSTAIAALSRSDAWSVGGYQQVDASGPGASYGFVANIEHWNGSRWSRSAAAEPADGSGLVDNVLSGTSFDSARDGWAVGASMGDPVAEHWNGSHWSLTPVLAPVATYSVAEGRQGVMSAQPVAVAAVSSDNAWLAGELVEPQNSGRVAGSFLEHWDGRGWHLVSVPGGSGSMALEGMHAFGGNDIWAVGIGIDSAGNANGPATLHFDGRSWALLAAPATDADTELVSVSGSSGHDVWAAGNVYNATAKNLQPFAEHWNGKAWSIVAVAQPPSLPSIANTFNGVYAISPSNAWAVGSYTGLRAGQYQARLDLLEHWDGHAWKMQPTPTAAIPNGLQSVTGTGAGDVWLGGSQQVSTADAGGFSNYPFFYRIGCHA